MQGAQPEHAEAEDAADRGSSRGAPRMRRAGPMRSTSHNRRNAQSPLNLIASVTGSDPEPALIGEPGEPDRRRHRERRRRRLFRPPLARTAVDAIGVACAYFASRKNRS